MELPWNVFVLIATSSAVAAPTPKIHLRNQWTWVSEIFCKCLWIYLGRFLDLLRPRQRLPPRSKSRWSQASEFLCAFHLNNLRSKSIYIPIQKPSAKESTPLHILLEKHLYMKKNCAPCIWPWWRASYRGVRGASESVTKVKCKGRNFFHI